MSALPTPDPRAIARSLPRATRSLRHRIGGVDGDSLAALALALGWETLMLALPARGLLSYAGCEVALALAGAHGGAWELPGAMLAQFAWPALALLEPFPSGWWWRRREGGRSPSQRERSAFAAGVAALQARAPGTLRLPRDWFVLDTPELDAALCGDTLMLSRGLLASEHLEAVLAHELGHLATGDGRLAAAIARLSIGGRGAGERPAAERTITWPAPPRIAGRTVAVEAAIWLPWLAFCACSLTLQIARGGIGLRRATPSLNEHWQRREYEADAFAASLGEAEQLADCLEQHVLIHDGPAPWLWRRARAHPPAELRIDRLRGAVRGEAR